MIIDHTHPLYEAHRSHPGVEPYNGAYYYSCDIVKHIIPLVKTDRNWVTIRLPSVLHPNHSIVFIHNNRNPNYYAYLKKYEDMVLVSSVPSTYENMKLFGKSILLPLSVDVDSVKKYRCEKDREVAYAGRRKKMTRQLPKGIDILTDMPQERLLAEMAHYKKIYAVGLTAIQAKILGCEIGVYDSRYPDPRFWKVLDCADAAKILQKQLDLLDGKVSVS